MVSESRICQIVGLLVVFALVPLTACGQEVGKAKQADGLGSSLLQSDAPMKIASDRMEVNQKDRTILFEGHVVVQQDDLTITGKKLRVYGVSDQKQSAGSSQTDGAMVDRIDRIEVEGDVKISQKDRIATSEKAVYYHQEQKIVLSGKPVVAQGEDRIQGRLITLYLEQGRSVVEGGEQSPVQATIHPSRKE